MCHDNQNYVSTTTIRNINILQNEKGQTDYKTPAALSNGISPTTCSSSPIHPLCAPPSTSPSFSSHSPMTFSMRVEGKRSVPLSPPLFPLAWTRAVKCDMGVHEWHTMDMRGACVWVHKP